MPDRAVGSAVKSYGSGNSILDWITRTFQPATPGINAPIPYDPDDNDRRLRSTGRQGGAQGRNITLPAPKDAARVPKKTKNPISFKRKNPLEINSSSIGDPYGTAPEWGGGDLTSFLSQAQGIVGDAGLDQALGIIANRQADAEKRASMADSRLAAMYDQLRQSILDDSGAIDRTYTEGRGDVRETSETAQQDIREGYETSQNTNQELLNSLGIGDARKILMAEGDIAGDTMRRAVNTEATRSAATQDRMTAAETAAKDFNVNNAAAAGMEGATRRADVQADLGTYLAQLADEQAQARMQYQNEARNQALSLAQQLYGDAYGRYQDQYGQWMDTQNLMRQDDATAWDRAMAQSQMQQDAAMAQAEAQQGSQIPWNQLSPSQQFNQQLQSQYGPNSAQIMSALSQATNAANQGRPIDIRRASQQLQAMGLSPAEIQAILSQYANAYGG